MGISAVLFIGQWYLYIYGAMYYVENKMTMPLNKATFYAIFAFMSILSFCITILALMPISSVFKKLVQKLTISFPPLSISPKTRVVFYIFSAISTVVLLFLLIIYWYGYINGTRTDTELKCEPSVMMGILIAFISLIFFLSIMWTVVICREVRKMKKIKKFPKE